MSRPRQITVVPGHGVRASINSASPSIAAFVRDLGFCGRFWTDFSPQKMKGDFRYFFGRRCALMMASRRLCAGSHTKARRRSTACVNAAAPASKEATSWTMSIDATSASGVMPTVVGQYLPHCRGRSSGPDAGMKKPDSRNRKIG